MALVVKNLSSTAGDRCTFDPLGRFQGIGKIPLEEDMATPSRILDWRIPWTEEPGRLQSTGSQRARHD